MTALALWIRPVGYPRWCRLLGVGALSMRTACHAPIEAREHIQIDHAPPECDRCTACLREIAARPSVAVSFDLEDLDSDYDDLAIAVAPSTEADRMDDALALFVAAAPEPSRTTTEDLIGERRKRIDPPEAWTTAVWEPESKEHER